MAYEEIGPHLRRVTRDFDPDRETKVRLLENPLPNATLGAAGPAIAVDGIEEFPLTPLIIPFKVEDIIGIEVDSIRLFRLDEETKRYRPIWNSGANETLGYFWANIGRPGIYLPIGLPRDVLLRESLRELARGRQQFDGGSEKQRFALYRRVFAPLFAAPEKAIEEFREFLTRMEIETGTGIADLAPYELRLGKGGHPLPFPLPHDMGFEELRRRIDSLDVSRDGLPEEELFRDPIHYRDDIPPWAPSPEYRQWNGIDLHNVEKLDLWDHLDKQRLELAVSIKWLFSKDWWMHQHDRQHTGGASGASNINATSAHRMKKIAQVALDGSVYTKPAIVDGKVYIGSGKSGATGGTLYRIDLATGTVEATFATSGTAFYPYKGIGGSPAVVGNRVYISTVYGKVYCVDRTTFTQVWMTDLKVANQTQNQPVNNPDGDSWSGPLVVNNRVYVSSGEGESNTPYGFVWCLDATTGQVVWLFCTNKFVNPNSAGSENQPNVIPNSAGVTNPLPAWATAAGFSLHTNPANKGSSPWSSCAYDSGLNRIYVCTGNAIPDTPLPDERYASGLLALDATTGQFKGFFQPASSDSYWPGDFDVDVPCSPTIYTRTGGQRVVCFGSKNGSFFILDADTLAVVARRQLLPRTGGTGLPGNVGTGIATVVPTGGSGENKWGVMATPAARSGKIYVGLGGYAGIGDSNKTPFMRAVDWDDLTDSWATVLGGDNVLRYSTTSPPMYLSSEAGLSAPAVVNDVVFMATSKTALYALDATTGVCLWSASASSLGSGYAFGPAIYGDYVVVGAGTTLYIYKLRTRWYDFSAELAVQWPIKWPGPWPPEPDPPYRDILQQILQAVRR